MRTLRDIKDDIKRQLSSYRDLHSEHRQITEELHRLELLMGPSSSNLDGLPGSASTPGSPVERAAIKHMALLERYEAQLEMLAEAQEQIEDMIEGLDPVERKLARFRYIDGMGWEEVCVAMAYSWRQTHRIHSRMLNKLAEAEAKKEAEQKC